MTDLYLESPLDYLETHLDYLESPLDYLEALFDYPLIILGGRDPQPPDYKRNCIILVKTARFAIFEKN